MKIEAYCCESKLLLWYLAWPALNGALVKQRNKLQYRNMHV